MKKEGALSKIRESEIDNQWFKGVKMTIVPRSMQEGLKTVLSSAMPQTICYAVRRESQDVCKAVS